MPVNLYEAMFVVDAAKGSSEFPEVVRRIANLLTRYGAEIERIEKWGERKLAFPIERVKRGLYVLVYFQGDGDRIAEIRHDIELSEELLRALIVRAEKMSPVTGDLFTAEGEPQEAPEAPPAPEEGPEEEPAEEQEAAVSEADETE